MAQPVDPSVAQQVHHELRNVDNSAGFLLKKLEDKSRKDLKILDVGSGSGTISASFAKIVPDGHVTGLDINPNIIPRARAVAEIAGVTNIDFQQGNVHKLPFADGTFDVTFCHQVLTHIREPENALREMLRVTKPGGIVAAREGDFDTEAVWPLLPGLSKFHKLAATMMNAAGGTTSAGRQLVKWALAAGVNRSQITLSFGTWSYHTQYDKDQWAKGIIGNCRGGTLAVKGVQAGFTTEEDLDEMARDWEQWAKSDESNLSMLHGEILIEK